MGRSTVAVVQPGDGSVGVGALKTMTVLSGSMPVSSFRVTF